MQYVYQFLHLRGRGTDGVHKVFMAKIAGQDWRIETRWMGGSFCSSGRLARQYAFLKEQVALPQNRRFSTRPESLQEMQEEIALIDQFLAIYEPNPGAALLTNYPKYDPAD